MLDWEDYPIPGVTFGHNSHYLTPFAVFKLNDSDQQASAQVITKVDFFLWCSRRITVLNTFLPSKLIKKSKLVLA